MGYILRYVRLSYGCRGLVEEYQSRALEARATLESLDERLAHLETQRSDTRRAIESIRKRTILQTGSSKAGVLQLEGDTKLLNSCFR